MRKIKFIPLSLLLLYSCFFLLPLSHGNISPSLSHQKFQFLEEEIKNLNTKVSSSKCVGNKGFTCKVGLGQLNQANLHPARHEY
nr:hypothetical protein CFP56_32759 [Quercus suber]